jgi:hypothetical protein
MYFVLEPMRPVASPRRSVPAHVPDSGSGLILISVVILLMAVIWKKLGFSRSRPDW